jgi:hypothetical protein
MKLKATQVKAVLFSIGTCIFSMSSFAQSPAIPNAGFETWIDQGQYDDPENWKSINSETVSFVSTLPVTPTTDAHSGTKAARLETINALIATSPGAMSLGRIVQTGLTDRDIRGGIPCTARPTSFEGYYKFSPVQNDRGYIACILFKSNPVTGMQDTVGRGVLKPATAVGSYTFFTVDIEYLTAETPDTMNIIVTSSYKFGSPKVGTVLFVDDLQVNYPSTASVAVLSEANFGIVPNPNDGNFVLQNPTNTAITYAVYDLTGKKITSGETTAFEQEIKLEGQDAGTYLIQIEAGENLITKRIVIKK